jgi:hypothetical protein
VLLDQVIDPERAAQDQRADDLVRLIEDLDVVGADVLGEDQLDPRPGDAHDLEHQGQDARDREVERHLDADIGHLREQPLEQRLGEIDRQVVEEQLEALAHARHQRVGELHRLGGDPADHVAELVDQRPEAGGRDREQTEQYALQVVDPAAGIADRPVLDQLAGLGVHPGGRRSLLPGLRAGNSCLSTRRARGQQIHRAPGDAPELGLDSGEPATARCHQHRYPMKLPLCLHRIAAACAIGGVRAHALPDRERYLTRQTIPVAFQDRIKRSRWRCRSSSGGRLQCVLIARPPKLDTNELWDSITAVLIGVARSGRD